MKQSLQLKLSQHLTLTPQLQQSIRLLQLSTLELNQEIERALQDNPLLERDDGIQDAAIAVPPGAHERDGASSDNQPVEAAQVDGADGEARDSGRFDDE